jgi:UDP-2,4-diacetamido-2,4,6-trideoxy-beta-L-altropyranose hydrolase
MGTGHVMRCLALAQAWQDSGGRAVFLVTEIPPAIRQKLLAESFEVVPVSPAPGPREDTIQTIALARKQRCEWIVVDGYQFGAEYQSAFKDAGFKVLFLDDYGHAGRYSADLVLNQNAGASASLYGNRDTQTRLLLGPRYCLLRREFAAWRGWRREISTACRQLLVMMGGSDPENLTARVIQGLALAGLKDLEVTIVVGGVNPHFTALQKACAESGLKMTVYRDLSNVAELMATADAAVSAAGSTSWELCLLGVPALLFDVASNQTAVAKELDRIGCAIHGGDQTVSAEKIAEGVIQLVGSPAMRKSLSQRSQELVDGLGPQRVVSALRGGRWLRLRQVRVEDRRLLWEWANDPEVRSASFSPEPIPWETHVAWFHEKVGGEKQGQMRSLMLIAEDEEATPVGQIRFDLRRNGEAEVNISLAKHKRKCGLSTPLIEAGVRELFARTECQRVHAFVKPENVASRMAFEKAGFDRVGVEVVRGHEAIHFDLTLK